MKKVFLIVLLSFSIFASELDSLIIKASKALDSFMAIPEEQIPPKLLRRAEAIAIIPNVIRGGFIAGARYGKGLLFIKLKNGWSDPVFIKMYGASLGWQIGLESIDVVLVFVDKDVARSILESGLTLAADASLAVGPVGRSSMVGAASKLQAQVYSYSRSMGAFVGVALAGSTLEIDFDANQQFYKCDPQKIYLILERRCNVRNQFLEILRQKLIEYTSWHE